MAARISKPKLALAALAPSDFWRVVLAACVSSFPRKREPSKRLAARQSTTSPRPLKLFPRATFVTALVALTLLTACGLVSEDKTPLKIGLMMNFSGGSAEIYTDRQRAFELAIEHINQAGGVFGLPVEVAVADTTADPEVAVEAARRLVEVEGVHAIVGPNASANALPIAETVIGPAGIPTITFSATSPKLTDAEDSDFFFRTVLSDVAQGPVLASVTRERGFDNVGVIYVNDAWGQGLARAFEDAWDGPARIVPIERDGQSFLPELRESASEGARALVIIAFEDDAITLIREALDNAIYDQFVFGDAAKRLGIVRAIGGDRLGGMYGAGPAPASGGDSSKAWEAAYADKYGEASASTYLRETYDATIALALAAQAAGSVDGAAIRDSLRSIGVPPGETAIAGAEGVADALAILADGGEVEYRGAAATLDWDGNGDLRRGFIGVWRYTQDERIEEVEAVPFR